MPCSICGKTGHNIRTHFNKMLNHIKENKKGIDEITNSLASVSISGYRTDGSSHSNGIKAEKETVNYFNNNINNSNIVTRIRKSFDDDKSNSDEDIKFIHQGGTKTKNDAIVKKNDKEFGISIKRHKKGTIDWINTTKSELITKDLKDEITNYRNMNSEFEDEKNRSEIAQILSDYIDKQIDIKSFLQNLYDKYPPIIIFNLCNEKQYVMYEKNEENFKEFTCYKDWDYYLKCAKASKSSRQIWRRKDGIDINTNLRLRLVLNNGITPLWGRSKKNKNTTPCVKIQQDNLKHYLSQVTNKTIDNY